MTAATYHEQIPEAAAWADQHSYLKGDALANAIQEDHLQWDPSILALLPFPSVLDMMARDPVWTEQLGNAVLTERAEVMEAVQRMRKKAMDYGYLKPNQYFNVVSDGGYVEILPLDPGLIYVPEYDPLVVFGGPAHGLVIGGAIRFGPGITLTAAFRAVGGILDWPSLRLAFTHHSDRSAALGPNMGQSGSLCSSLRGSATHRPESRAPRICEETSPIGHDHSQQQRKQD